ncbi:MAG: hypothetical protein JWQ33_122 [Ramlibacter sp.]|nr:hypothetical protein [Ramlibacter sp.]
MSDATPFLGARDLLRLAAQAASPLPCPACAAIASAGWEAIPGSFERKALRRVGTLRAPGDDDPTLHEHHPAGTNAWSPDAPIAPAFFPYNRCDVWQCTRCSRTFLRYTEYGGYYEEERIRPVDAALVVDTA